MSIVASYLHCDPEARIVGNASLVIARNTLDAVSGDRLLMVIDEHVSIAIVRGVRELGGQTILEIAPLTAIAAPYASIGARSAEVSFVPGIVAEFVSDWPNDLTIWRADSRVLGPNAFAGPSRVRSAGHSKRVRTIGGMRTSTDGAHVELALKGLREASSFGVPPYAGPPKIELLFDEVL